MKKYISLLSIAVAFMMQSCERSDSNYDMGDQIKPNSTIQNKSNSVMNVPCSGQTTTNNFKPGGDDDPDDRDKQHWKFSGNEH